MAAHIPVHIGSIEGTEEQLLGTSSSRQQQQAAASSKQTSEPASSTLNKQSIVFVTGADEGLGLNFAIEHCRRGDLVIATALDPEGSRGLQELCQECSNCCVVLPMDVSKREDIERVFDIITRDSGGSDKNAFLPVDRIDLLYNNAGLMCVKRLMEVSQDEMERLYMTDVVGPLMVTQVLLPLLNKSECAKNVCMSSVLGSNKEIREGEVKGEVSCPAYSCAKAALNNLWTQFALLVPQTTVMGGGGKDVDVKSSSTAVMGEKKDVKERQTTSRGTIGIDEGAAAFQGKDEASQTSKMSTRFSHMGKDISEGGGVSGKTGVSEGGVEISPNLVFLAFHPGHADTAMGRMGVAGDPDISARDSVRQVMSVVDKADRVWNGWYMKLDGTKIEF